MIDLPEEYKHFDDRIKIIDVMTEIECEQIFSNYIGYWCMNGERDEYNGTWAWEHMIALNAPSRALLFDLSHLNANIFGNYESNELRHLIQMIMSDDFKPKKKKKNI